MVVILNGEVISSIFLFDETANSPLLKIEIPPGLLRFGENRLTVRAFLLPHVSCEFVGLSEYYLKIENDSLIHIPMVSQDAINTAAFVDLQVFPKMFLGHSDLGNLAFVLPKGHSESWNVAANIAYFLGDVGVPALSNIKVVFGDEVPEDVRQNNALIVIGKSSTLPLLAEINDGLPAPFEFETDTASEKQMQVVYRVPSGVSLGYLEMLASPFNDSQTVLVVAGNTDQGVILAGSALTEPELKRQISGMFVVTNGTQVVSSRVSPVTGTGISQTSIVGDVVTGAEEVIVMQVPEVSITSADIERPVWLMPVLFGSAAVFGVVILYLIVVAISKKRSN